MRLSLSLDSPYDLVITRTSLPIKKVENCLDHPVQPRLSHDLLQLKVWDVELLISRAGGGRREEGARVFFPCDNEGWPGFVLGEQIGGVGLLVNCCDYNSSVTNSGITWHSKPSAPAHCTAWRGSYNFSIRQYVGEIERLYEGKTDCLARGASSVKFQYKTVSGKSSRHDNTNGFSDNLNQGRTKYVE